MPIAKHFLIRQAGQNRRVRVSTKQFPWNRQEGCKKTFLYKQTANYINILFELIKIAQSKHYPLVILNRLQKKRENIPLIKLIISIYIIN